MGRVTRLFSEEKSTEWMKEARAVADLGFHTIGRGGREDTDILFSEIEEQRI